MVLTEIGNAYAVLSNPDKRKQYDLTGAEEPTSPGHAHSQGFDFHRGFEADITPEDLFNMFFGGGFSSCKRHAYILKLLSSSGLFVSMFNKQVLIHYIN